MAPFLILLLRVISTLEVVNKNGREQKTDILPPPLKEPAESLQASDEFDYVDYIPPVESYVIDPIYPD